MFKQSAQHVASYYAQTYPTTIPLRPALQGALDTDVLIIGAGFSGLHTALRLALAGKRVVVLEASRVAWAASGRNGGQALLGWSCEMPPLEKALGVERARRLWDSMRWAAEEMRELPERHGFDVDYRVGSLWTAVMPRRVKILEEAKHEAERKWGYDCLRLIGRDELPDWIDSPATRLPCTIPTVPTSTPSSWPRAWPPPSKPRADRSSSKARCSTTTKARAASSPVQAWAKSAARCWCWPATPTSTASTATCRAVCCRSAPTSGHRAAGSGHGPVAAAAQQLRDRQPVRPRLLPPHTRPSPAVWRRLHLPRRHPQGRRQRHTPLPERVFPQLTGVSLDYAWGGHLDCSIQRTPDIGRLGQRYWLQGFGAWRAADPGRGPGGERCDPRRRRPAGAVPRHRQWPLPRRRADGRAPEAAAKAWYRLRDYV